VGALPRPGANPELHHCGTISRIAALFGVGVQPDADDFAMKDPSTARAIWTYYPVIFASSARRTRAPVYGSRPVQRARSVFREAVSPVTAGPADPG